MRIAQGSQKVPGGPSPLADVSHARGPVTALCRASFSRVNGSPAFVSTSVHGRPLPPGLGAAPAARRDDLGVDVPPSVRRQWPLEYPPRPADLPGSLSVSDQRGKDD